MKSGYILLGIICFGLAAGNTAQAQPRFCCEHLSPGRAVTERGDELRGIGYFYWALGQYERNSADAKIQREKAARLAIANRESRIQSFWVIRDAYDARFRALHAARRATNAELCKLAIPVGVDVKIYDAEGDIPWPLVLREDKFAHRRKSLESLLIQEGVSKVISHSDVVRRDIRDESSAWLSDLQQEITTYHATDYLAGRQFLVALRNQAARPPRSQPQQ